MGFLDRLFGRKEAPTKVDESLIEAKCPHASLRSHWERPEDFGKHELISSYVCETCGETFSREEGERLMVAVGESVRETVEIDESMRKTVEEEAGDAAEQEKGYPL
jgi:transposase-like protein